VNKTDSDAQARTPIFADRWLLTRAGVALVLANARYWSTVAPQARSELSRWKARASQIEDLKLRTLAMQKLSQEGFAAEVAATLATLTPRRHRGAAVRAIVALEVMFDYLDGLTERPARDQLANGRRLFKVLSDALDPSASPTDDYYRHNGSDDGGYLRELGATVSGELACLPATATLAPTMLRAGARCSEAEVLTHAGALAEDSPAQSWAVREANGSGLEWREYLAGAASSVLSVHALIALAGDERATVEDASAVDAVYLAVGVLSTMLDSVVDYEQDQANGTIAYIEHYEDTSELGQRLAEIAQKAAAGARGTRRDAHHLMTIAGVVAYFTSAPTARSDLALPVTSCVQSELRPLITPALAVMRAWRMVKRIRALPRIAARASGAA
jgi:tetraprenyl-beta-curcumene synthase